MVDAAEIMLGAGSSTRVHVVVDEDFLQLFLGSDGVRGEAYEPVHRSWRHEWKIVCHDTGVSSGGANGSGISL